MDGWLYVAHMEPAFAHASHYVGWSENPGPRFVTHLTGQGSPLIRAAIRAGSQVSFMVLGRGTRADERRLHNRGGKAVCPICRDPLAERRRKRQIPS